MGCWGSREGHPQAPGRADGAGCPGLGEAVGSLRSGFSTCNSGARTCTLRGQGRLGWDAAAPSTAPTRRRGGGPQWLAGPSLVPSRAGPSPPPIWLAQSSLVRTGGFPGPSRPVPRCHSWDFCGASGCGSAPPASVLQTRAGKAAPRSERRPATRAPAAPKYRPRRSAWTLRPPGGSCTSLFSPISHPPNTDPALQPQDVAGTAAALSSRPVRGCDRPSVSQRETRVPCCARQGRDSNAGLPAESTLFTQSHGFSARAPSASSATLCLGSSFPSHLPRAAPRCGLLQEAS